MRAMTGMLGAAVMVAGLTGSQHVSSLACSNRPDIHLGAAGQPNDCSVNGPNPWARGLSYDAGPAM
jgi:hypothetical protein